VGVRWPCRQKKSKYRLELGQSQVKLTIRILQFVAYIATSQWELACRAGSYSVTCHPTEVAFPSLPQPKPVLDLAVPRGCKAELT